MGYFGVQCQINRSSHVISHLVACDGGIIDVMLISLINIPNLYSNVLGYQCYILYGHSVPSAAFTRQLGVTARLQA